MSDRLHFLVDCNHVSPRYQFKEKPVRVSPAPGHNGYWYADTDMLGCSKDYSSPENAIRALFNDHACSIIKIVEVEK